MKAPFIVVIIGKNVYDVDRLDDVIADLADTCLNLRVHKNYTAEHERTSSLELSVGFEYKDEAMKLMKDLDSTIFKLKLISKLGATR